MSSSSSVKTKPCSYGCGTTIYWNTEQSKYYELNTRKQHFCPNRQQNAPSKPKQSTTSTTSTWKPKEKEERPPMSNSIMLMQGTKDVRQKYEYLSDLIIKAKGRVHGSQSHMVGGDLLIVVYYEVPEGYRDNVKESFKQFLES